MEENHTQLTLPHSNGRFSYASPYDSANQPERGGEALIDLGKFFGIIRRRILLITGITTTVATLAVISAIRHTPEYEGKFQLLVAPIEANNSLVPLLTQSLRSNAQIPTDDIQAEFDSSTQVRLLTSQKLLLPVIQNLQTQYPDIDYNSLVSKLIIGGQSDSKKSKNAESKIIEVSYHDSDRQKVDFVLRNIAQAYVNYSVNYQKTSLRQGLQFINSQLPQARLRVNTIRAKIQRFREQHGLLEAESQGQHFAGQVNSAEQQQTEVRKSLNEARALRARLEQQLAMQPDEALAASTLSGASRYQDLLNQLQQIETQIATESIRVTNDNPSMQLLVEKRESLLSLIEQEAQRVMGGQALAQSELRNLGSQSSTRLKLIEQLTQLDNEIQGLETREQAVAQSMEVSSQKLAQFPALVQQMEAMKLELELATNYYKQLLVKQNALNIESGQQEQPWEIIGFDQLQRSNIDLGRNLALGVLLGLLLGLGAALIIEKFSDVYQDPEAIQEDTGLNILEVIPLTKEPAEITPATQPVGVTGISSFAAADIEREYISSPFLEAFRSLYVKIHYLDSKPSLRSLLISSSVAAEGKTTIAVRLSLTVAAMGHRVLLVDTDLHRPQVHRLLGLKNQVGLSDIIRKNLDINEAIQHTHLDENLSVLTTGEIPSDPMKLLSSGKMQDLMKRLHDLYDLVIYDTPPLLGLSDTGVLASQVDGTLLTVRLGQTKRSAVMKVVSTLEAYQARPLGVVVNSMS